MPVTATVRANILSNDELKELENQVVKTRNH